MLGTTFGLAPGHFRIEHVRDCGTGGLGTVDEVRVVATNGSYAVGTRLARKRLNANWKSDPTAQARFEREIVAISKMNHARIVPFKGQNVPGEERFYVMPVYKCSVRDLINQYPMGFAWKDVARLGSWLAEALHYAHLRGYTHRDLKPENMLRDADNNIVVSDWGLGYFVHQYSKVLNLTIGPMGTQYYCSGEQWLTGKCDARGDIYSLGIVLAELVRGHNRIAVFPGIGLTEDPVIFSAPGTADFNAYLRSMTSHQVGMRPDSMLEVQQVLSALAQ